MKVRELIEQLLKIENKELEVYVNEFSDIGGWSSTTTNFKVIEEDNKIFLMED